jgi:hypothetical protein
MSCSPSFAVCLLALFLKAMFTMKATMDDTKLGAAVSRGEKKSGPGMWTSEWM